MECEKSPVPNDLIEKEEAENPEPVESSPILQNEDKSSSEDTSDAQMAVDTSKDTSLIDNSIDISRDISSTLSPEDLLNSSEWDLDQLAWARMSIYPFWPCMVTYDPSSSMVFQKVSTHGKSKTLMIHVHFFNDHGRHSWVPAHHMIPFNGIEEFRKRASLVTDAIRKKEPKFAAALTVKPSVFKAWQKAVAEAMDVLSELDMTSLEMFKPQAKNSTSDNTPKINSSNKKRKRKESNSSTKKMITKSTTANEELKVNTTEDGNSLSLETPPISPMNGEDLRAAAVQKQKRITKMINKLQPPDFEVYLERNFFTIKEQHSDATDEQVRQYLLDVWEHMATEEKLKYRATYKIDGNR